MPCNPPFARAWLCALAFAILPAFSQEKAADEPPTENPEVEQILNRHVKAMGDLRLWDSVQMTRTSGHFELQRPGVHFVEWRRRPYFLRIQWTDAKRKTVLDVGCNRDIAWYVSNEGGVPHRETIPIAQADSLRSRATLEDPIIQEARTAYRNWTLKGVQKFGDTECYVIEHAPKGETPETFFIDRKTYYILRRERKTPRGTEAEEYGDYRMVNDIPWAHRLAFFENGTKSEVSVINSVTLNVGIGSPFFRPPPDNTSMSAVPPPPSEKMLNTGK